MQARCPRCTSVFTTDRSGLQFCPNCGQQVDVPTFEGAPPEGTGAGWGGPSGPGGPGSFGPGAAVREDTPWERRATIGWWTGFWETWKRTLISPQLFWASVKPNGSWTDALLYAWIIFAAGVVLTAPFKALGMGFGLQTVLEQMKDLPPAARAAIRNSAAGVGGFQFVFSILLYPVILIIGSAIQHLFCMVFGVAKNGYYATLRVVAYAGAVSIFTSIPCVGIMAILYYLVLATLGFASVQESSLGRAAAAVLAPFVLLCCCGTALATLFGAALLAAMGNFQGN
jgi:hypothetical protein